MDNFILIPNEERMYELVFYINNNPNVSNSIVKTVKENEDLNFLTDVVTTFLPLSSSKKLEYMREINGGKRAYSLIKDINLEIEYNLLEDGA